jgi:hypothetical protein
LRIVFDCHSYYQLFIVFSMWIAFEFIKHILRSNDLYFNPCLCCSCWSSVWYCPRLIRWTLCEERYAALRVWRRTPNTHLSVATPAAPLRHFRVY